MCNAHKNNMLTCGTFLTPKHSHAAGILSIPFGTAPYCMCYQICGVVHADSEDPEPFPSAASRLFVQSGARREKAICVVHVVAPCSLLSQKPPIDRRQTLQTGCVLPGAPCGQELELGTRLRELHARDLVQHRHLAGSRFRQAL